MPRSHRCWDPTMSLGCWRCHARGSMRPRERVGSRRFGSVDPTDLCASYRTTSNAGSTRREPSGPLGSGRAGAWLSLSRESPARAEARQRGVRRRRRSRLRRERCSCDRGRQPGDCRLGRDSTSGEHVTLQMAVIALGRADVGVAELPLDVHQGVARGQPRGGRGVAQGVERHILQGGVLEGLRVPVAGHRRAVERQAGAGALPPSVAALDRPGRHHEQNGRW